MKLAVMSDSHGYDEEVRKVLKKEKNADYFIHLGDLCSDPRSFPQLIILRGNNDYDHDLPLQLVSEFCGLRIFMCHGHRFLFYQREEAIARQARENDCRIALFGHTHDFYDNVIDGVRLLNPGSLMYNRSGAETGYLVIDIGEDGSYQVTRKLL
ncbi:MAG: metallophosphoesterase [Erysipelotrichaceae bacterium]|nr:metallophosphoesterase [Erysipelotrichaceae bacterium]MBR5049252.1 metallophosphoesterase [Erysipelotrichaceae bacterium]